MQDSFNSQLVEKVLLMLGTFLTWGLYLVVLCSSPATCCLVLQPRRGDIRAFIPCQQQKLAAGAGWTRLGGNQLFPALQWLHGSKPSKLNVGWSELLTPEMLDYSVKETSRTLELRRG